MLLLLVGIKIALIIILMIILKMIIMVNKLITVIP